MRVLTTRQHVRVQECSVLGMCSSSSTPSSSSNFNVLSVIKPAFLKTPKSTPAFLTTTTSTTTTTTTTTSLLTNSSHTKSFPFISCRHSPILSHSSSFRPKDDELENSSEGLPSMSGGIVALGKFDALHVGHRELAIQASRFGTPFLMSFMGMAEVFGWEPRAPVVAKCDRERVLSSWAPLCSNVAPKEFMIDFSRVRHLTPSQFVAKLAEELGVHGVVAGENYRFGYKAAGDASELVRLCNEYGMKAYIIKSVMDKNKTRDDSYPQDKKDKGQVSSTRVRDALSKGRMEYVSKLLGRHHRLVLSAELKEDLVGSKSQIMFPKSSLLNLPPKDGLYDNCSLVVGGGIELPCKVLIDSTHIHLQSFGEDSYIHDSIEGVQFLGIEFKG